MRLFACDNCKQVLFFENSRCIGCQQSVGYSVEAGKLISLPGGADPAGSYEIAPPAANQSALRCKNFSEHDACNWLVLSADAQPYCRSCRLTEVIPDLTDTSNRIAWFEIEAAKRRLLYTLDALQLPICSRQERPQEGLAFRFLRDTDAQQVMTGHAGGIITLNIAEADASFRENMREKLGEGYRTVLGHLRHEIGHYYWDRLVNGTASLEAFRQLFGDERQSYDAAIARHYNEGPPINWAETCISAYATMHPWEDWAETWAHYLHMVDTLETAKSHGLTVRIPGNNADDLHVYTDALAFRDFDSLMSGWNAVTLALNSLNRSMGMKDVYPFVLSAPVQSKLRFVHELIWARPTSDVGQTSAKPDAASAAASRRDALELR